MRGAAIAFDRVSFGTSTAEGAAVIVRKSLVAGAVGAGLVLGGAGTMLLACSSSSNGGGGTPDSSTALPVATCTDGGLTVAFSPMYSAFDGKHTFSVPAVVRGSNGNVQWSADSTYVNMSQDLERPNEVLITMKKAGAVVINVESIPDPDAAVPEAPKCGSSILTISSAAESDWEIGSARYNDGTSLHLAGSTTPTAGGASALDLAADGGGGPACNNCHGETATSSVFKDVSHTPEQTGGFSDDQLLGIILHGQFPDSGYFDPTIVPYVTWSAFHRWSDITTDQQRGIIVYLRSLVPAPQKGEPNFGAFDDLDAGSSEPMDSTVPMDAPTETTDAPGDESLPPADASPQPDGQAPPADAGSDVEVVDAAADAPADAAVDAPADGGTDAAADADDAGP
jgi:hypothetical protein